MMFILNYLVNTNDIYFSCYSSFSFLCFLIAKKKCNVHCSGNCFKLPFYGIISL